MHKFIAVKVLADSIRVRRPMIGRGNSGPGIWGEGDLGASSGGMKKRIWPTYRAATASRPLTMLESRVPFLSFVRKDGLWKATHDGSVLLMTLSHSRASSGVSLWGREQSG